MGEWLSNLVSQLRSLPPQRQLVLGLTAAGSLAFFLWLSAGLAKPEFRPLYRGLADDEVASVADALEAEKIEYRLADGGTTLLVPAESVYEARMRVAGRGLPTGSSAGFELFDRPAFGVTDFVHRVNYARAVQGELARSIEQLDPVKRARVQVALPERSSVIAARERRPSASVVVGLQPGRQLGPEKTRAVVHLVASAIEGLDPADVTVVDDAGRLLAPTDGDSPDGMVPAGGAPAFQQGLEAELAGRIESMLEKTVGPGGVIARVRADMDWSQSETTEEIFDPDSQVARSEQRTTETSRDGSLTEGGVPGVASNTPDSVAAAEPAGGEGSASERTAETINYEISKTVRHQSTPRGRLDRLSIAVLVAERPGEEPGTTRPWDAESLSLFESLTRQAVGFDEDRGDRITVTSAPFRAPDIALDEEGTLLRPEWVLLLMTLARGAAILVALVLFARLVVRPALEALARAPTRELPARVSELEADFATAQAAAAPSVPAARRTVAEQIGASAGGPSEESIKTLRNWLNQG